MNAQEMHEAVLRFHAEKTDAALENALLQCDPLLKAMARRLANRGIEYEDLYQTACLACVQAIRGFNPDRGLKFSTYVTPTVMGTLQNYIRDKQGLVHTPRSIRQDSILLSKERAAFLQEMRREPTPRELSESWAGMYTGFCRRCRPILKPSPWIRRMKRAFPLGKKFPTRNRAFCSLNSGRI